MNVDKYGLPIQADGDNKDQLNRVGMIALAARLNDVPISAEIWRGLVLLSPKLGIYARYIGGDPENVSADQLIPIIAVWASFGASSGFIREMYSAMMKRWGFAQNVVDGLNAPGDPLLPAHKIPDFMYFRAMPLFSRMSWTRYFFDLYLFVLVLGDWVYQKTNQDPADVNCTLATFCVCLTTRPTFISRAAGRLWSKLRDINAAMKRYHRAEEPARGNPEIAEMYVPIVKRLFNER